MCLVKKAALTPRVSLFHRRKREELVWPASVNTFVLSSSGSVPRRLAKWNVSCVLHHCSRSTTHTTNITAIGHIVLPLGVIFSGNDHQHRHGGGGGTLWASSTTTSRYSSSVVAVLDWPATILVTIASVVFIIMNPNYAGVPPNRRSMPSRGAMPLTHRNRIHNAYNNHHNGHSMSRMSNSGVGNHSNNNSSGWFNENGGGGGGSGGASGIGGGNGNPNNGNHNKDLDVYSLRDSYQRDQPDRGGWGGSGNSNSNYRHHHGSGGSGLGNDHHQPRGNGSGGVS